MREYVFNTESTGELAARLIAEQNDTVSLFQQVMPEPEGRDAYEAHERWLMQGA